MTDHFVQTNLGSRKARSHPQGYVIRPDGCWEWVGARNAYGYGRIRIDGHEQFFHRAMYERAKGPIPPGLTLDHLCRNRACGNPAHLEAVTLGQNILRGVGPSALNAQKTHCPNGHPFVTGNLEGRWRTIGDRLCLVCRNQWRRARYRQGRPGPSRAEQTHCVHGHPLSGDNLVACDKRRGVRRCRVCENRQSREYQRRRRAARRSALMEHPADPFDKCGLMGVLP